MTPVVAPVVVTGTTRRQYRRAVEARQHGVWAPALALTGLGAASVTSLAGVSLAGSAASAATPLDLRRIAGAMPGVGGPVEGVDAMGVLVQQPVRADAPRLQAGVRVSRSARPAAVVGHRLLAAGPYVAPSGPAAPAGAAAEPFVGQVGTLFALAVNSPWQGPSVWSYHRQSPAPDVTSPGAPSDLASVPHGDVVPAPSGGAVLADPVLQPTGTPTSRPSEHPHGGAVPASVTTTAPRPSWPTASPVVTSTSGPTVVASPPLPTTTPTDLSTTTTPSPRPTTSTSPVPTVPTAVPPPAPVTPPAKGDGSDSAVTPTSETAQPSSTTGSQFSATPTASSTAPTSSAPSRPATPTR